MKQFIIYFFISCWALLGCTQDKVTYRFAPKIGQSMVYTTTSVTETSFFWQPITFTNKVKTKETPISKENGIFTLMSQIEDLSTTVSDPKANAAIQEKNPINQGENHRHAHLHQGRRARQRRGRAALRRH